MTMNIEELKKAFKKHQKLSYPRLPDEDWADDLAELDGFYAGLATTLIQGKALKKGLNLHQKYQQLIALQKREDLTKACQKYIASLVTLGHLIEN